MDSRDFHPTDPAGQGPAAASWMQRLNGWIWTRPSPQVPKWKRTLQKSLRILWIFLQEARGDALTLRASALTFTVIFSLVPVLALTTAVLKGLGAGDEVRQAAYQLIERLGEMSPSSSPPAAAEAPGSPSHKEGAPAPATFKRHLYRAVDTVFDYVDRTNFATLGAFGIVGLVVSVLSLFGTLEDAMNVIWQAKGGRSIVRRVADYLALLFLLPLAVNLSIAVMAALESKAVLAILHKVVPVSWAGNLLINLFLLLVMVGALVSAYLFLPNAKVRLRAALVGACLAGAAWLILQAVYIRLQVGVARQNAIYGSFATLPLFLMWIYMGWVVFLGGAEMAFAAQVWRSYTPSGRRFSAAERLACGLDILAEIFGDFHARQPSGVGSLAQRVGRSQYEVRAVLADLEEGELVRRFGAGEDQFLPVTSAEDLQVSEVIGALWGTAPVGDAGGDRAAREVMEGAQRVVAGKTLRDLGAGKA